jgi:hypothetical protein
MPITVERLTKIYLASIPKLKKLRTSSQITRTKTIAINAKIAKDRRKLRLSPAGIAANRQGTAD